jgi:hypothetical protein
MQDFRGESTRSVHEIDARELLNAARSVAWTAGRRGATRPFIHGGAKRRRGYRQR